MSKPILLDLFCKAGGSTRGFQQAGFCVIGVDKEPQPNYVGDLFLCCDALAFLRWTNLRSLGVVAIAASPPCQFFTDYRRKGFGVGDGYENLIPQTRELLKATGLPYVIENVERARNALVDPIRICGTSFPELDVQRHRLFESNIPLVGTRCAHHLREPRYPGATNRRTNSRRTVEVGVWRIPLDVQQRAMGIDWMELPELSEAIPPAYMEHIGKQLMDYLKSRELLSSVSFAVS